MTQPLPDPRDRRGDRRRPSLAPPASTRAYVSRPGFVATLDNTPAPAVARGLHPTEFEAGGGLSFAWTEGRVTLIFEGLDRSRPWTLSLRAKAGRGPGPAAADGDHRRRRHDARDRADRSAVAGRPRGAADGGAEAADPHHRRRRTDLRPRARPTRGRSA